MSYIEQNFATTEGVQNEIFVGKLSTSSDEHEYHVKIHAHGESLSHGSPTSRNSSSSESSYEDIVVKVETNETAEMSSSEDEIIRGENNPQHLEESSDDREGKVIEQYISSSSTPDDISNSSEIEIVEFLSVGESEGESEIHSERFISERKESDVAEFNEAEFNEESQMDGIEAKDSDVAEFNEAEFNEESQMDGIEASEKGVLYGISDQEKPDVLEDEDEDLESPSDHQNQDSLSSFGFGDRNDGRIPDEIIAERNSQDFNFSIKDDSTISIKDDSTKWNLKDPFVKILADLLLIAVIVGIIFLSRRGRESAPSSTDPSPSFTLTPAIAPSREPTLQSLPINNICTDALGPLPSDFSSNFGTIENAEVDNVDRCGDIRQAGPGVWYYTIGTGGEMMAHTCLDTTFNSKITIFGGTCDKPFCQEANDDFCGSSTSQSAVSWSSVYGELYYILVTGDSTFQNGSFNIVIGARSNDECSTAIGPLATDDPMPVSGSTIGATANDISCNGVMNESNSVWYLVRGTGSQLTADLCEETDFAARITILTGSCANLECTSVSSTKSCSVTWQSKVSRSYYILIGGQTSDNVGDFSLRLSTTDPPDNSACKDAIGPLALDGIPIKGSTTSASAELDVPFCISAVTSKGLWYYVEGNGSILQASLCDSLSYDTRISIYRGSCIEDKRESDLVCVDGNDDFCGKQSLVTWNSEIGVTYYILVHGYLQETGDFSLTVTEF
jgi:hypothetical protein